LAKNENIKQEMPRWSNNKKRITKKSGQVKVLQRMAQRPERSMLQRNMGRLNGSMNQKFDKLPLSEIIFI